jgi:hypothetical protein
LTRPPSPEGPDGRGSRVLAAQSVIYRYQTSVFAHDVDDVELGKQADWTLNWDDGGRDVELGGREGRSLFRTLKTSNWEVERRL